MTQRRVQVPRSFTHKHEQPEKYELFLKLMKYTWGAPIDQSILDKELEKAKKVKAKLSGRTARMHQGFSPPSSSAVNSSSSSSSSVNFPPATEVSLPGPSQAEAEPLLSSSSASVSLPPIHTSSTEAVRAQKRRRGDPPGNIKVSRLFSLTFNYSLDVTLQSQSVPLPPIHEGVQYPQSRSGRQVKPPVNLLNYLSYDLR